MVWSKITTQPAVIFSQEWAIYQSMPKYEKFLFYLNYEENMCGSWFASQFSQDKPEKGPVSNSVSESKFQSLDQCQSYVGDSLPFPLVSYPNYLLSLHFSCGTRCRSYNYELLRELISKQAFTEQTLSQNLYCLENSPLDGASMYCKHLQY